MKTETARHTFTPGPWHRNIKPASKYSVIFAGRNTHVATVCTSGLDEAEIESNCNLIAAAPRLLAALRGLLDMVTDSRTHGPEIDEACDAIIAAAQGGPNAD